MAKAANIIKTSLLAPYYYITLLAFFFRGLQEESFAIPVQMLSQLASSRFLLLPFIGKISVLSWKK